MNVKYTGIKALALLGFIAVAVIFHGFCRMEFNMHECLRQQVKLLHHPSLFFKLAEDSLQNNFFLIQRDSKAQFIPGICPGYKEALTLPEKGNTKEKKQLRTTNNRYADLFRHTAMQDFILNALTNNSEKIPVHIFSAFKPKPVDNNVLIKTLTPETHG